MTRNQLSRQLSYCFRRMEWAETQDSQDYWWRKIQDLGAVGVPSLPFRKAAA